MDSVGNESDDEYSTIGDKGDIGFIDLQECTSVCSYNPAEESEVTVISVPFPFVKGKPQSGLVGETIVDSVTITNSTSEPLDLWSVKIYDSKPEDCFTLSIMKPPTANSDEQYVQEFMASFSLEDRIIRPRQTLIIWLSCKPTVMGLHQSAVHFSVGDETIERLVFVMAENKLAQSMASRNPFYRVKKNRQPVGAYCSEPFVVGSRPSKASRNEFKNWLPMYPIPQEIRSLLEQKQIPDAITEGLTRENYASYFKTLLFMEEIKMEEDMRDYDMESVKMRSRGFQFLSLEVPGLAERRPSIVFGDFILAKCSSGNEEKPIAYQGFIHRVEAEEVCVKFRADFHQNHLPGNLYNVQFTFNRVALRRLHQAIEAAQYLGTELLFPSECRQERLIRQKSLAPISGSLNEEQMCAVELILGCKGGSPYVIHGPPGTGKTMTLIEAILQLYSTQKNARILVCAPSNSATDHILGKLLSQDAINLQGNEIFRLNAATRPLEDLNPEYAGFCYIQDSAFKTPHLSVLALYRIIISTYSTASLLHAEGIKRGHFSHIFLDEAGQASEPETMVALSHFYRKSTVIVLAGDPLQLGPVIYSRDAEMYGSGKPYLERLFECKLYNGGNKNYITRLVRNYRCNSKILYLPSKLFYDGQLISCKESDSCSPQTWLDLLPNQDFPVLFMGIQGLDEREGSNPSWFNRIEASKVVEIIANLIDDKGLCEEDIGVITPYRQQVLKIRTALEGLNRFNIKVGSVEQFQGQERKIIIVSTVRSTIKHNEFDRIHYLGFLSNPKRFNVAITRAQSLLILVGNPHIITKDKYWNQLLWYCWDNESYTGCFLPPREEVVERENVQECDSEPSNDAGWVDDSGWGDNSGWANDSIPADDVPNPVTDETEWSDGWK